MYDISYTICIGYVVSDIITNEVVFIGASEEEAKEWVATH